MLKTVIFVVFTLVQLTRASNKIKEPACYKLPSQCKYRFYKSVVGNIDFTEVRYVCEIRGFDDSTLQRLGHSWRNCSFMRQSVRTLVLKNSKKHDHTIVDQSFSSIIKKENFPGRYMLSI